MLIAHLPAGYLLSRAFLAAVPPGILGEVERRRLLLAGLLASILPDFDLSYHVLFDAATTHRSYWTHAPLFWLAAAALSCLAAHIRRQPKLHLLIAMMLANVLLHLGLDTVSGPIRWLYPFSDEYFRMVQVPRGPHGQLFSHLTHWTMLLELAITFAAAQVAMRFPLKRAEAEKVVTINPYSL
jgi:inner membrane protein